MVSHRVSALCFKNTCLGSTRKRRPTLFFKSTARRRRLAELKIRVTPKSSRNRVEPGDPVKVFVTAAPADNEANKAVVETLAKALGVPKSRIEIVRGATGRSKTIEIQGVCETELAAMLASIKR